MEIKIGLFGFGKIGRAFFYSVTNLISQKKIHIEKICVKDRRKRRVISAKHFTFDCNDIFNDTKINTVVVLISEDDEAYELIKGALAAGKNVLTCNIRTVINHYEEFWELQKKNKVILFYESFSGGGERLIKKIEKTNVNERISSIKNFFGVEPEYFFDLKTYNAELRRKRVFTESDFFEIGNQDLTSNYIDVLYDVLLIGIQIHSIKIKKQEALCLGVQSIKEFDIEFASKKKARIKLTSGIQYLFDSQFTLFVIPEFVNEKEMAYNLTHGSCGTIIESTMNSSQFYVNQSKYLKSFSKRLIENIEELPAYTEACRSKRINAIRSEIQYSDNVKVEVFVSSSCEEDIQQIIFDNISEKYSSPNYYYIIGEVKFRELIQKQNYLIEKGVFVASTGKEIKFITPDLAKKVEMFNRVYYFN